MRRETNQSDEILRYLWTGMLGTGIIIIAIVLILDIAGGQQNDKISIRDQLNNELAMQLAEQKGNSTSAESVDHRIAESNGIASSTNEGEASKEGRQGEQAETKQDEEIEIAQQLEGEQASHCETSTDEDNGKLNINTATLEQFQTLKGIGPAKAQAILDDRELKGQFKHIEDLKRVKGIGEKLFAGIKESIVAER